MPDPDNKRPRRTLKNLPPDRFHPKALLVWLAFAAAAVALLKWSPGVTESPRTLLPQDVMDLTSAGHIKSGTIRYDPSGGPEWAVITGEVTDDSMLVNERGTKTNAFIARGRLTEANTERLQKSKKFVEPPTTTMVSQIVSTIAFPLLIIGVLYFLFVRQLRQAGRGAMNFGKSRAKLLTRDRDKITFSDVAGCDEAKEEISEVVEFLKDPKKFTKMGGRMPKGILMVGPPGTGKTLLAKAVAG